MYIDANVTYTCIWLKSIIHIVASFKIYMAIVYCIVAVTLHATVAELVVVCWRRMNRCMLKVCLWFVIYK